MIDQDTPRRRTALAGLGVAAATAAGSYGEAIPCCRTYRPRRTGDNLDGYLEVRSDSRGQ